MYNSSPGELPWFEKSREAMAEAYGFQKSRAPLAIVTGASSGIGRAIAASLSQRGFRLGLIARDREALEKNADEWRRDAPCVVVPMDLTDTDSIGPSIKQLLRTAEAPADVLVCAAGCGVYQPVMQQTHAQHLQLWQINYLATFSIIRAVLPGMLRARRGHVIAIASMSSKIGPWGHAGYAGAKAAVVSLMQTLAAEHDCSGVHFSYVNPGIVDTPFFQKSSTHGLWSVVAKRAIPPVAVAKGVMSLLDRPRLEICIPRYYRMLDLIRAISVRLAHRLVRDGSRPQSMPHDDLEEADIAPEDSEVALESSQIDSLISK
jgi:short-subunit dehydrogenase